MDLGNDKMEEEGFSIITMFFLIALGFLIMILGTDYQGAFTKKQSIDIELARVISNVTIEEVEDGNLMDRELHIEDFNITKTKIAEEAKEVIEEKFDLDLRDIKVNVTGSEKIYVDIKGTVIVPLMLGKDIEMPVSVSGRGKAQRFDIED